MKLIYFIFPFIALSLILAVGAAHLSGSLYKTSYSSPNPSTSDTMSFCGWLPWWQYDEAVTEVVINNELYTHVSPFIYSLQEDYSIKQHISNPSERLATVSALVIPTISNDFNSDVVSEILNDKELLETHINDIVVIINDYDFDGIEIDYEELYAEDKDPYTNFIAKLASSVHNEGKLLVVTLHPKTSDEGTWDGNQSQDWPELAKHADYLRIMAYDYHWSTSPPGPLSPKSWLQDVTDYAIDTIPQEKRILGIGLYGYDWEVNSSLGVTKTLLQINSLISEHHASPIYDDIYESPYITYNEDETEHVVWFEDARSLEYKLNVAEDSYAGICIWSLGEIPEGHYTLLNTF